MPTSVNPVPQKNNETISTLVSGVEHAKSVKDIGSSEHCVAEKDTTNRASHTQALMNAKDTDASPSAKSSPSDLENTKVKEEGSTGGKNALPSIKATQKDRSKNASAVETQHKMMLLVEILRLLDIYKAHSTENKFQQWSMVQDALEKQTIGSQYRRMDKAYCFRKKVLNAIDSWIDWASVRGYPKPHAIRKYPSKTWKVPPFLELLYKIYNESIDSEKHHLAKVQNHRFTDFESDDKRDDDRQDDSSDKSTNAPSQDEVSINSTPADGCCNPSFKSKSSSTNTNVNPPANHIHLAQSSSSYEEATLLANSSHNNSDEIDHDIPVASVIQAVSSLAHSHHSIHNNNSNNVSLTPSSQHDIHLYLQSVISSQNVKKDILAIKRSALQAELDDMDLLRLEGMEAKLANVIPGSEIHGIYTRQKDRIIARLERRDH